MGMALDEGVIGVERGVPVKRASSEGERSPPRQLASAGYPFSSTKTSHTFLFSPDHLLPCTKPRSGLVFPLRAHPSGMPVVLGLLVTPKLAREASGWASSKVAFGGPGLPVLG